MIFDRYRKPKRPGDTARSLQPPPQRPQGLASAFLRKLPHALTRRAWQVPQKRQDSGVDFTPPRQSTSLPNIARLNTSNVEMVPATTTLLTPKADSKPKPVRTASTPAYDESCPTTTEHVAKNFFTTADDDHHHHHHQQPTKRARNDGNDKPNKAVCTANVTAGVERLSVSSNELPTVVLPQRSQSHQIKPSQTKLVLPRAHSISTSRTNEQPKGKPLSPDRLASMFAAQQTNLVLIDVRNLFEFQRRRIKGSLNVNLPSLLIKRYQRGTVSNFNLENFITTPEGRERYANRVLQSKEPNEPTTPAGSSIFEQKAAEAVKKRNSLNDHIVWVVYDEDMQPHSSTQAWTLISVLERAVDANQKLDQVHYLDGGFKAFESEYEEYVIEGSEDVSDSAKGRPNSAALPRRSASYTIGTNISSKNDLHRRTSLFSLDTQAARANNANALARRASRRSQQAAKANGHLFLGSGTATNNDEAAAQAADDLLDPQQLLVAPSATTSTSSVSPLARVLEDEDEVSIHDSISPQTENDFDFVISEIIPGFLFVGPEIETVEQAAELELRKIRRVLNMAEECNDEVLQGKVMYRKIAARDTVEMKNIDWVMMEAVNFIEEAKRSHEPVYVHCKAGKSRSVTAILAYLVTSERWTLKKAYRHVIKARPNMSPNIGFIAELMKMEGRVHGRVSSFMETDWQSTSMPSPEFTRELKQLEHAWQQTPCDAVPPVTFK